MTEIQKKKRITIDTNALDSMEQFATEIEVFRESCDTYKEAIVYYCEDKDCDIEDIIELIPKSIVAKMYKEELDLGTIIDEENNSPEIPL